MTTKTVKTKNSKGQAMRDARRRLGWTQLDLAQRAGCSEAQVTKIETGRLTPEQWLKEAIARELNIASWEVGV
jgi:ribosome-binding protein aMBF1 (putative translation factor)